jgi:hypothetical protein
LRVGHIVKGCDDPVSNPHSLVDDFDHWRQAVGGARTGTLLRGARMMCYKERAVGIARIKLSVSESSTRRRTESGVT